MLPLSKQLILVVLCHAPRNPLDGDGVEALTWGAMEPTAPAGDGRRSGGVVEEPEASRMGDTAAEGRRDEIHWGRGSSRADSWNEDRRENPEYGQRTDADCKMLKLMQQLPGVWFCILQRRRQMENRWGLYSGVWFCILQRRRQMENPLEIV
jgi:hypothetical protein